MRLNQALACVVFVFFFNKKKIYLFSNPHVCKKTNPAAICEGWAHSATIQPLLAQCCNGQELLAALERRNSLKKPGPFCPMKREFFQLLLREEIELKIHAIPPSDWANSCPLHLTDIVSLVSEVRAIVLWSAL